MNLGPSVIPPSKQPDAGRLEALLRTLFLIGASLDLHTDPASPRGTLLRRVALEDGGRPTFRWCEVQALLPVDYFAQHPAASIWEMEVVPVIRADGGIRPEASGGCARTQRQARVRLCGQFVTAAPGCTANPDAEQAALAALLDQFSL